MAKIGSVWKSGSWNDADWAANTWAGITVPPIVVPPVIVPLVVPTVPVAPPPVQQTGAGAASGGGGGLPQELVVRFAEPTEEEREEAERERPRVEPPKPAKRAKRRKVVPPLVLPVVPEPPPVPFPEPVSLPPIRMARRPVTFAPKPPKPAPPPPRVIMVTRDWGGLGIALLMQRQGSDVLCAFDYGTKSGKELSNTQKIGDGLVEKMSLETARQKLRNTGSLWLFDDNSLPKVADELRDTGELVLGTSILGAKLEEDRHFAMDVARSVGFDLPDSEEFTDYDSGIQFLEAHPDQAWAYKPDKQDPTMTYVPQLVDDPAEANRELVAYLRSLQRAASPKFVLQEVVQGIEANFELWVADGRPLLGLCDLEAKRKLVGDLGENIGCAGDFLFALPMDVPIMEQTVGRYLDWPALRHYTGSVDANVIFGDGKTYFLENCFRFGYNAYPTILQDLATEKAEDLFRAWINGESCEGTMAPGFGSSLSLVETHPTLGTPIQVPSELEDHVYLYRAYGDETGLHMVEQWSEILCVTGYGETMEEAGQLCLKRAEQVSFPNKGYRIDLAGSDIPTVPLARYQALQRNGSLPDPELEEAVMAFVATL